MAYGQNPLLHPAQVQALLAGWVDIIQNPQVGRHVPWHQYGLPPYAHGVYGSRLAYLGADPATGAPITVPSPMPAVAPPMMLAPMGPPPMPMAPMGPPPMSMAPMGPPMGALAGYPFPPAAALVDAPPPTFAARDILPMSTGVPILPTQSAQITGRPQARAFAGKRFMISNAGTAGGAADWIVNNLLIGNRSQFVQSGDVPGDLFAVNAIDTFVRFETAQTAMDVVAVVTYIGLNESGCPFFGALIGTAAI